MNDWAWLEIHHKLNTKNTGREACQLKHKIKSPAEKHFADNNLVGTAYIQSYTCNTQVLAHLFKNCFTQGRHIESSDINYVFKKISVH